MGLNGLFSSYETYLDAVARGSKVNDNSAPTGNHKQISFVCGTPHKLTCDQIRNGSGLLGMLKSGSHDDRALRAPGTETYAHAQLLHTRDTPLVQMPHVEFQKWSPTEYSESPGRTTTEAEGRGEK